MSEELKAEVKRKTAPDAAVSMPSTASRLEQEQFMDGQEPAFKHVWGPTDLSEADARALGISGISEHNGKKFVYGGDQLYKIPAELWGKRVKSEGDASFERVKRTTRNPDELRKTPKAIKVQTREQRLRKSDE